ncbi:hypothetical protein PF003_g10751 [Phytophthora fragariae]|nr:hypothetical protein PF003_g10751 [Phytophthora fragariae]
MVRIYAEKTKQTTIVLIQAGSLSSQSPKLPVFTSEPSGSGWRL